MSKPFLTARWTNLALITYDVDPATLAQHIPRGCELDTIDGRAFVSLVAFDFLETRVLGVRWPGFVNFPEINLRFYVHRNGERGVAFIREFVPSKIIAGVARLFYNEPYSAVPMHSETERSAGRISTTHRATVGGAQFQIQLSARDELLRPDADSREHFFKEHALGYGTSRRGKLITYDVSHPCWEIYRQPTIEQLDWDFARIYGEAWRFLNDAQPTSLILAAGSEVSVNPRRIS